MSTDNSTSDKPISVTGTVTANAGTNLDTSALALESGGNLASINTVSIGSTTSGTISALNGNVAIVTQGQNTVYATITGSWVATLQWEAYDGVNWVQVQGMTGVGINFTVLTSSTANTNVFINCGGSQQVRIKASAYTSGTINVQMSVGRGAMYMQVMNTTGSSLATTNNVSQLNSTTISTNNGVVGAGVQRVTIASDSTGQVTLATGANTIGALTANQSVNCAQMNGVAVTMGNGASGTGVQRVTIANDSTGQINALGTLADNGNSSGTNRLPTLPSIAATTYPSVTSGRNMGLRSGTDGLLWTASLPPLKPVTYSASAINVVAAAAATDIFVISGNATTTTLVTRLTISATQTTGGVIDLALIKRSTADTAGTSASVTAVPNDSNNAAASTAVLSYSVNPTTGTAVGNVRTYKMAASGATGVTNDILDIRFSDSGEGQPIVLRGTAQQLCVNLNGQTVTGNSFNIAVEWLEI